MPKSYNIIDSGPFPNTPPATPATYQDSSDKVVLSVSGNKIVNNKGTPVTLKGFARPSLEWNPQGQFLGVNDIKTMASWGVNTVRLSLFQDYWFQSASASQKGSYKQIINAFIQEASQYGMAVILDLHWTNYGYQNPMANKDSIRFWREVAEDYQDFGTVMFELFNEPFIGGDVQQAKQVWLKGDDNFAGYQQLYNAVRSTGSTNICIINGLNWGYDLSFVNKDFKVAGFNIAYGSHPYNREKAGTIAQMESNYQGVLNNYPLFFTEYGVNQNEYFPTGYQDVYDNILTMIRRYGIHETAWAWWVENDPNNRDRFPCIIEDWTGRPINGGVQIQNDLIKNPVMPINSNHSLKTRDLYSSNKKDDVHQSIAKHIKDLQSSLKRNGIISKLVGGLADFIPAGIFSPLKGLAVMALNKVLDIDGVNDNHVKIHALQTILSAQTAQEAQTIIQESAELNHHRNIFKRLLNKFIPDLFMTESRRLAEKLADILPKPTYQKAPPAYAQATKGYSPHPEPTSVPWTKTPPAYHQGADSIAAMKQVFQGVPPAYAQAPNKYTPSPEPTPVPWTKAPPAYNQVADSIAAMKQVFQGVPPAYAQAPNKYTPSPKPASVPWTKAPPAYKVPMPFFKERPAIPAVKPELKGNIYVPTKGL